MKRYKTVDDYMGSAKVWKTELKLLRTILLDTDLQETVKWGAPCYTYGGKNVVGVGAFKSYVALWFHQGGLLKDEAGVLINAQEGKTRALRQWRFASTKEIKNRLIKSYVKEAIANLEQGHEIKPVRGAPVVVPVELKRALAKNKKASTAYKALTPGRQREYADHVSDAKRDETKQKRIKKIIPMIVTGEGLHDTYRNC